MKMKLATTDTQDDARLVELSRDGNRDAFGQIVERYQSLVCALTYSACGNLQASEDLAQVTFITAWCQLRKLREPSKLKSWLCAIARNAAVDSLRSEQRQLSASAETLGDTQTETADATTPRDQVISKEEEAILWRSLGELPATYREPLVLFYRQNQSIAEVAAALELSEDAVKQRLSRGRALLAEQVATLIEGALGRSTPGTAFTLGVMAALPALTTSAKVATIGAAAAKGSATAKAAAATGLLSGLLGTLLVGFGNYLGYRSVMDNARTDRERDFIKAFYRRIGVTTFALLAVFASVMTWADKSRGERSLSAGLLINSGIVLYVLTTFAFVVVTTRKRRKYYSQVRAAGNVRAPAFEFRSRASLFGLPLVHIRIGEQLDTLNEPVTAWIAVGNFAVGGLFAFGGLAIAPASIGFCAVGLLPLGGLTLGVLALGAVALGVWAFGGLAIGWQSFGCFALAWNAASGDLSLARDFALGHIAQATQINNDVAREFIQSNWFFRATHIALRHSIWLNLLWVTPLVVQWRTIARARRR